MSTAIDLGTFSSKELKELGININTEMILQAYRIFISLKARKEIDSLKCTHYFDPKKLWDSPSYKHLEAKYRGKPFEWRYNVLEMWTVFGLCGVKEVYSNTANRDLGLPRQNSTLTIRNTFTGDLLGRIEATEISNARTAFPALRMMELCFTGYEKIPIFALGAGPVMEWIIRLLMKHHADRISSITICTPKHEDKAEPSSRTLVKRLGQANFNITAVTSHKLLPEAKFVIAATSNGGPLFRNEDLAPDVRTLSLSYDEMPAAHIENVLENGHVFCDDIAAASKRGAQSLQRWFEGRGTTLEKEWGKYGIRELASSKPLERDGKPVHCTAVGLGSQDLVLGILVFLALSKKKERGDISRILMNGLGFGD